MSICQSDKVRIGVANVGLSIQLSNSLFGYNKYQVEKAIEERDAQITTLQAQVQEIQAKLDEYIAMEQALKDGIVDARLTGNKIVNESNEEADRILKRTNEQVTQYKEEFAAHSHDLVDSGMNVRSLMNDMKKEMQKIILGYQEMLENTDFDALYPDNQVERFAHQIRDFESLEIEKSRPLNKKMWDNTSITEEEKKELEKLIHEVIANEKNEQISNSESKLVKFAKM